MSELFKREGKWLTREQLMDWMKKNKPIKEVKLEEPKDDLKKEPITLKEDAKKVGGKTKTTSKKEKTK
jgi:hypothetical protein